VNTRVVLTPAAIAGGGGGHVVRCLALADALERAGAECQFVVEPLGAEILARLGRHSVILAASDERERLATIIDASPNAVVVDDYRLDAHFEAALAGRVMAIDDLANRPHAAAIVLDSGYGRQPADYEALAPLARLLLGPEFALLREGFAGPAKPVSQRVGSVFVSFGLSDVGGIAARAVSLLRPLASGAIFDVALSADAESLPSLRAQAASDPGLRLHIDADVAPLMRAADLGIGGGGGMVWERRASGLPQLVVILAENQRPTVKRLAADGVILAADLTGPRFEVELVEAFKHLLDPELRRALLQNPHARCDGRGADRAAQALLAG